VIRQAYRDLVRVWHPDRFQSDPELQRRAQQHLQSINDAYLALKNAHLFEARQEESPPAPRPKPTDPGPAGNGRPRARGGARLAWNLFYRWPIKVAWLCLVLAPLAVGGLLFSKLRVPTLESVITQNGQTRPAILSPSDFVSPRGDRQAAAAELSHWARGEVADLWKSIPKIGEQPSERSAPAANGPAPSHDAAPGEQARAVAPGTPLNGTELLRSPMSGGSQLWISNQANQDAVATLVTADTAAPVRVVYIQAKNKACIRHIAPGLYNLLAETGENWDRQHVRFQAGRQELGKNGPFQCLDVTAGRVISGQCLDVSAADGDSRPAGNIVLGAR
jgi:hypothetical protein